MTSVATVVGLGHALLGDDAVGLAVLRALETSYDLPSDVTVVDAGSCGLDLVGHLLDSEHLIFVDAVIGGTPGTVRTVEETELRAARPSGPRFAPHEPAIHDALALLDLAGHGPRDAVLVGVVPACLEVGTELSAEVARAVPRAVSEVVRRLEDLGLTLVPKEVRGLHLELDGTVQGVGMRPWLQRTATRLGLRGTVANGPRGVVLDVFGSTAALGALRDALAHELPPLAKIEAIRSEPRRDRGPADFTIQPSLATAPPRLTIPADRAMCEACRAEVDDPSNRRYRHPFASCIDCGPRYTIVRSLPYDRERTSMAEHPLCADCAREHGDPTDRRFWAETNCCPTCGPRLWLEAPFGTTTPTDDPIAEAARRIEEGAIVAVQGLGGIHLACDATNERAVAELRRRKRRGDKPFAILTSLADARTLAVVDRAAETLLASEARPIVLLPRRPSKLAPSVAPRCERIGLLLPYTPLHHLLLSSAGRPLVLTSANASAEPIAIARDDAGLIGVADAYLLHDRAIVRRAEDSVVVPRDDRVSVVRRGRGYAPRSIRLSRAAPEPILAVGGQGKSTACLVIGDEAYLTPHLGDLESHAAEEAFRADVEAFERLFAVRARFVVHDRHPGYASTRYALERRGAITLGVQHHHAHALAAAAEQHIEGPFVATVLDGSGFGDDGTMWGGEILRVDGASFTRLLSTRPIPLAGGERAIHEIWRPALALLRDAFGDEAEEVFASLPLGAVVPATSRRPVGRMLDEGVNVTAARGIGRYFDAYGALCLGRDRVSYEGEVAIALEAAAAGVLGEPYAFSTDANELDFRPATRALVADVLSGISVPAIAARLHATFADAIASSLAHVSEPVVLTGGCFQNGLLDAGVRARVHAVPACEVPVNDGGLALGQAWAGVLALRAGGI